MTGFWLGATYLSMAIIELTAIPFFFCLAWFFAARLWRFE